MIAMGLWDKIKNIFRKKKEPEKPLVEQPDPVEPPKDNIEKYIDGLKLSHAEIYGIKSRMLIAEAVGWLYVREDGQNRGEAVERFQREVDGKANGEPWCMSFVQFCVNEVDRQFADEYQKGFNPNKLYKSEHVMTCWNKTDPTMRIQISELHPGCIIIWQHYKNGKQTSSGHVGIVKEILANGDIITIEGNTHNRNTVVREGDGVFEMRRKINVKQASMRVKGFLRAWDGYNGKTNLIV